MSKNEVKIEEDRIAAAYKTAKARCDKLSANAKDICMAEAKGAEKVAKAELDVRRNDTPNNRYDLRIAKAETYYEVAKERCDELSGNTKDVCIKDAKSALTKATADARVERESGIAATRSNERVSEARIDAAEDKRKAEYAAAKERCDAYSGKAKEGCITDAKNRYGMN
jgi:hypothetical protein